MNWVGDVKSIVEPFTNFIISITGLGAMYWGGKRISATIRQREKRADVIVDRGFYEQYTSTIEGMKKEISELRQEQARERDQWATDRLAFQSTIDSLRQALTDSKIENATLRGEVAGLRATVGQVKTAMQESDQHYNTNGV